MKIKRKLSTLIIPSLIFTAPMVASSCNNNVSFLNQKYKEFKQKYNQALEEYAYQIVFNKEQIDKDIETLREMASNNQLRYIYGDRNELVPDQMNKIPNLPFNLADFTAEYLVARQLVSIKFNDETLNQNITIKYAHIHEDTSNGTSISFKIIDQQYGKNFAVASNLININNLYPQLIRYGITHTHYVWNPEAKDPMPLKEAYSYLLSTELKYKLND
ncbi:hypothetical protein [Mycoplasmopsis iners]|uniref:hypothetical protein n=1 Tax=Mycoplasmopsis iners TaxID=76630 RepID=UPI000496B4B3|nr:hypothetical protein [Mycoplasmopsis iners]